MAAHRPAVALAPHLDHRDRRETPRGLSRGGATTSAFL
jgi:hypothetical protein